MFNLTFHKQGYENSYSGDTAECPKPRIKLIRGDTVEYIPTTTELAGKPEMAIVDGEVWHYLDGGWKLQLDFNKALSKLKNLWSNSYIVETKDFSTIETGISGTSKFCGGVLYSEKEICFIPSSHNEVLFLNTETEELTKITGFLSGSVAYWGGVLAPNGCIYAIPHNQSKMLKIDTKNKTISNHDSYGGYNAYRGGVLAPNGKIYAVPYETNTILEINPETDSSEKFGSVLPNEYYRFRGAVLGDDGKVYGIARDASKQLVVDTVDKVVDFFSSYTVYEDKWSGGVLAPNGCIYAAPYAWNSFLEIDTINKTTSTFGNISGIGKMNGGVLAPNGKIYFISENIENSMIELDYTNKTVLAIVHSFGKGWSGGVLAPNGCIYAAPSSNTKILKINVGDYRNNGIDSPFFNKF